MSNTIVSRARRLRRESTTAERALWAHLRAKRLCGVKFRRQHPEGPYIVDFACCDRMVVIELDGSQHASQWKKDERRDRYLAERGYTVLRFWNFQVFEEVKTVLEVIRRACV